MPQRMVAPHHVEYLRNLYEFASVFTSIGAKSLVRPSSMEVGIHCYCRNEEDPVAAQKQAPGDGIAPISLVTSASVRKCLSEWERNGSRLLLLGRDRLPKSFFLAQQQRVLNRGPLSMFPKQVVERFDRKGV